MRQGRIRKTRLYWQGFRRHDVRLDISGHLARFVWLLIVCVVAMLFMVEGPGRDIFMLTAACCVAMIAVILMMKRKVIQ